MKPAFPLHRFSEFGALNDAEMAAARQIADEPRRFPRYTTIRAEGVPPTCFYLLVDGWVAAAHHVSDGRRQILKVHLPGDALGTPSMCMARSVEELTALTDAQVMAVPLDRFGRLFERHPRLAAKFMLSCQLERVALMDRLISIGRTSGEARVAAFIMDIMERLEPLGLVVGNTFVMQLTQEQIGDVVGLTSIHVNRVLKTIEEKGLISRSNHSYTVHDPGALDRLASRPRRERAANQPWLPQPRP